MNSTIQKKIAAKITKRSVKKIRLDLTRLDDIKEAITRADIKGLIKDRAILIAPARGVSRGRAKKHKLQRSKGRRRGHGSRKGKQGARLPGKRTWINKIRLQRYFLKELKDNKKITQEAYKDLYRKSKGGFFRSVRHIKLYLTERKLVKSVK
jgi:large subunit ribosomal protein L19e